MSHQSRVVELKKKLQFNFPINVTLPDPISGVDFTVQRADLMSFLLFDASSPVLDAETVAGLYAEMARCQRAAERASDRAAIVYRQWKSQTGKAWRKTATKPTDKGAEEAYRTHPEYAQYSDLPDYYKRLAALFDDLKKAFEIKSKAIGGQRRMERGHETTERGVEQAVENVEAPDGDRIQELADEVFASQEAERNAAMAPYWAGNGAAPPPPTTQVVAPPAPESGTVDATADDEDSVPPPPPPVPSAKAAPKTRTLKKKTSRKKKKKKRRAPTTAAST